jgi:hypothetical protein
MTTTGRDGSLSRGEQDGAALWLAYLGRIIACGEGIAETARIQAGEGSDARLLAACLLARSISTASAVVHLIGLGHVVEARILARSLFENKFYLYRSEMGALRRFETCSNVSNAQIAAIRRWLGDRGSARARAPLIGLISPCKPPRVGRVNSTSLFHTTRSPASARGRLRGRMTTAPCPTSKLINSPCHPCRRRPAWPEPPSSSASRRPWPRWLS